jgi:hypothetical protein
MKYVTYVILFALVALFTSCVTTVFGGKVIGPYKRHFNDQLECAKIEGWSEEAKCFCRVADPDFSNNKTFLESDDIMCEKEFP